MSSFPPPVDFGLPSQFPEWRPGQMEAVLKALDEPKRIMGAVLPTGFGKSLMYMATAHLLQARTVILTSTKALQRQLMHDFGKMPGTAIMQGQRAYSCVAVQPGGILHGSFGGRFADIISVEQGPCHVGVDCALKLGGCPYYDSLRTALRSRIVITNYAWWFSLKQMPQVKLQPDLLVCDEAHAAPDALADALGTTIRRSDIYDLLTGAQLGKADDRTPEEWRQWAKLAFERLGRLTEGTKATDAKTAGLLRRAQWLEKSLKRMVEIDPHLLCVSDTDEGIKADVIWAAPYAEEYLFRGVPKVLMTSATFTKHTATLLGVAPDDLALYEAGDGFPKNRRPVYQFTDALTMKVDHRITAEQEAIWLARIDQIIGQRLDRKGIIHAVSYRRRDLLKNRSAYGDRMITHDRSNAAEQIAKFKAAGPGTILVSPSVTTGYDFPYDECEYQIICKIPFPDGRDPVTKARTLIDKLYPMYVAIQELVQAVGRGMRAQDDQCETFIVDRNGRWLLSRHMDLTPRWFRRALRRTDLVPAPPPRVVRRSTGGGSTPAAPAASTQEK